MTATANPKVVGVIPAYNSADFIEKSLLSLLAQDYRFLRRIVIDDHSSDNTYELITSKYNSQVEIVRNEQNSGFAYSLNCAISMAGDADFLFILEDDIELADQTYITRALKHFTDDLVAVVCGQAVGFDRDKLSLSKRCFSRYINADYQETGIKEVSYSLLKSDLFRISALKQVDGFGFVGNPKLGIEDQVLAKKLHKSGFILLKDASLIYNFDIARRNTVHSLLKSESNAGSTLGVAVSRGVISLNHKGTENQSRFSQRARQVIFTGLALLSLLLFAYSYKLVITVFLVLLVLEFFVYIGKSRKFVGWEKLYFAFLGVLNDFVFSFSFYYGFISGLVRRLF